jgi:hypothetical protein
MPAPASSGYTKPENCPPDYNDYTNPLPGTYAYKLMTRGWIPLFGGLAQSRTKVPDTCAQDNVKLQTIINRELYAYANAQTKGVEDQWKTTNTLLQNMMTEGAVITALQTMPVIAQLLYLSAGIVALIFLSVAILVGI